jgi:hypothetical protein
MLVCSFSFCFGCNDIEGGCDTCLLDDGLRSFFRLLLALPKFGEMHLGVAHSEVLPTPAGVEWYVSMAIARSDFVVFEDNGIGAFATVFLIVHQSVRAVLNFTLDRNSISLYLSSSVLLVSLQASV